MTDFDQFPHEINRMIGSYLDYNSRVEFSQLVSDHEDQYIKRLNSDEHNLLIKKNLITQKFTKIYKPYGTSTEDLLMFLDYLCRTKDTVIFEHHSYREYLMNILMTRYLDDYFDSPWFHYISGPYCAVITKQTKLILEKFYSYKPILNYKLVPLCITIE